jgi:SAM-dependent methyltransferase
MNDATSEARFMSDTYKSPPDKSWYEQIALPCSWRLIHGRLSNKRVLDLGCGNGWIAYLAREEGAFAIATDIYSSTVLPGIDFVTDDKENLHFTDNSFDFVLTANVLHHGALDKTCSEALRILKPGGELISLQEPCIENDRDEEAYLKVECKQELSDGINEHRPSLLKYRKALSIFSQNYFYEMGETVWGNVKQALLKPLTADSYFGGIAIRAIKQSA